MSTRRTTTVGLLLLTATNLFQVIGTNAADLKLGQTLKQISPQMILDPIVLEVAFLGWYLARKPAGQTTK